ncbi:MAG: AMP-binding protein [Gammaproteobacteria bacterium]
MSTQLSLNDAALVGMAVAVHARESPERVAVVTAHGERTHAELNAAANRLARALRAAGLEEGDSVAMVSKNRPEFCEALMASYRAGFRFTPVNFHLKGEEIGYVVDNCEAKAFIADASLGPEPVDALRYAPAATLRLSVGGSLDGFEDYGAAIARHDPEDITDPALGSQMLYTSGTTGRPKGVRRDARQPNMPNFEGPMAYSPDHAASLCTGPGYHAAPLVIDIMPALVSGAKLVMMDRWDAEETLRLIEAHRVTHSHMVATMFHRMLQLPEDVRSRYDVSSLAQKARHRRQGAAGVRQQGSRRGRQIAATGRGGLYLHARTRAGPGPFRVLQGCG